MEQIDTKFGLVIVLYNPSAENKVNVLRLASQYCGVIVDNSESASLNTNDIILMHYIPNAKNLGIAEGQNIGVDWLIHNTDVRYILFMDQDTLIDSSYAENMVAEYAKCRQLFPKLAILGPMLINKDSKEKYESVVHQDVALADGLILRREIISSGSCVAVDILKQVGLNDSSLFIDYVDFEWCWRAESKGYLCAVSSNVTISHKVGARELSFGSYKVIISSPFRYYYQYRNYLWLLRRNYVPMQWKVAHGIKFLMRFIYFPLFVSTGYACWKNMIKGIKAGLVR